jgi:hypothetical protein
MKPEELDAEDIRDRRAMRAAAVFGTMALVLWCVVILHFVVKYW